MESLYDLWGKRNPEWEKRYQDTIMNVFTDYGKGVNQFQDIRGKIFGAGYEIYIIAYFIGLYHKQRKPLIEDKEKRKVFGQAIMYWGNIESRGLRNAYGKIREYIFVSLIARSNVDFLALDKGEITPRSVVDELMKTMEEYANFGFDFMQEKLEDDPNYFFKESAFLRIFTSFLNNEDDEDVDMEIPDALDDDDDETETSEEQIIDEENQRKEAEKPWSEDDIDKMLLFYNHGMEIEKIAERLQKSIYSVQYQLSLKGLIKMPLNVTVKNNVNGGVIYNQSREIVYTDEAKLKILSGKIYRFNLKPQCLTVKDIIRSNENWVKGNKILVAYPESSLFQNLSTDTYINDIEDIVEGDVKEKNRIKMNGIWYDYYGDTIKK